MEQWKNAAFRCSSRRNMQLLREDNETLHCPFHGALELPMEGCSCPRYLVREVVETAQVIARRHGATNKVKMVLYQTRVGLMTLELLADMYEQFSLRLVKQWEVLAYTAAWSVREWEPDVFSPEPASSLSLSAKMWVVYAMSCDRMCPQPLVRLELMRFAAMLDVKDMIERDIGITAACGLLSNVQHLTVSRLLPEGRPGLLCVLRKLVYNLHISLRLEPLIEKSCQDIESVQVSEEVLGFANLVVVMAEAARWLRRMRCKNEKSTLKTIEEFSHIVQILRLLTGIPPNQRLYELPGMCQLAGDAIAATLRCIVTTPVYPDSYSYRTLLSEVDGYFLFLDAGQGDGTLLDELRRHHGDVLTSLHETLQQRGWQPVFVPKPLEKKRLCVVDKFKDSRTKRLLTLPVRLEATGEVVDLSTLLRLKLLQWTDTGAHTGRPRCDLTYTPLHELRDELRAWKFVSSSSAGGGVMRAAAAGARPPRETLVL